MPMDFSSSSADGMGAVGVSFNESNVAGLANPAEWGSTVYSLASGGLSLQHLSGTDYAGTSETSVFSANHFQLQLPIQKNKVGISVSVAPLTRSNYKVFDRSTRILGPASRRDTLTAQTQSLGSGGINSFELGIGWKINENISVGYAGSLVLASIENEVSTVFDDSDYQGVTYTIQTNGTGFGNRFGTQITLPNLLKDQDYLKLGAAVNLPVVINSERIQESEKQVGSNTTETITIRDEPGLGNGDIHLPLEVSGGLTYQSSPKLSFTTEALYEQWSDLSYDFGGTFQRSRFLSDRYKAAFGLRYFPFVTRSNKFLSRFKYRAGVSYDTGHLKINGKKIETLLFSAGLGIPSPNSNSSIDISFHYGMRGTEAQNLVKESIWGMKLSINLAELMFYRRKLR